MANAVYRRAVDLLEADVGNELVALNAEAGNCFGFNEVATTVWRSLVQPKSFDQIRDQLLDEYDVDVERCTSELGELLDDLVARGLLDKAE